MKSRVIACGVMICALAAGGSAVAQGGRYTSAPGALGTGFMLPERFEAPVARSLSGLRLDTNETWWGLPGTARRVQIGMAVAPRFGTGLPLPALTSSERLQEPIELGPGLRWRSAAGTLSATFQFDPTGVTEGESLRLSFSSPLISSQGFRLLAYVGAEWHSGRTALAVRGFGESGNTRPLFSTGSAANVGFGLDTHYQLTRSSAIVLGASGLRFGGAPVDGALYADRWQATLYGGYSFRF